MLCNFICSAHLTVCHTRVIACAASLAIAGSAAAGTVGLDFRPFVVDGSIFTASFDDGTGQVVEPNERVLLIDLQSADSFGTDSPGYNVGDGGFAGNSILGMNFQGPLFFWDGQGSVDFQPVTSGDRIRVFQGIETGAFLTGSGPTGTNPYFWLLLNADGNGDGHAFSQAYGPDGDGGAIVGDVTEGIYYNLGRVLDQGGLYDPSETVALVYNTGGEDLENAHELAGDFIRANIVPEPSVLAGAAVLAGAVAVRRRRR